VMRMNMDVWHRVGTNGVMLQVNVNDRGKSHVLNH